MSMYIQWALYGKDAGGNPLPEEKGCELRDALDDEVTEWHGDAPVGECIAQFLTTYNDGYSNVTDAIGDYAQGSPDCLFQLFCHNEDEDWYQQIHFHGDDREVLNGHIAYDTPQRIFYDPPSVSPKIMIALQNGSVQGVFADSIRDADVTIIDLDLDKLDSSPDDDHVETLNWINEKLSLCQSMYALYGRAIEEV